MRPFPATLAVLSGVFCLGGCEGRVLAPTFTRDARPSPEAEEPVAIDPATELPPPPACRDVRAGQRWIGLGGQLLGAERADVDVAADTARFDTFLLFQSHVEKHIGVVVHELMTADVAATFGGTGPYGGMPVEWYIEPERGPMVLYTNFRVAFQACQRLLKAPPHWVKAPEELTARPTVAGATARCRGWMEVMWAAEPTPEQVAPCVTLLTEDVADEPSPLNQWAAGCAAVFSSSQGMSR